MKTAGAMTVVADENIPLVSEFFTPFGTVLTLPGRALSAEHVADADIVLVRSVTRVDAALLRHSRARFIGTCTIGTDHLDCDYLQSRGIGYANAPGSNANSVIEYVFSSLCALDIDWRQKTVGIIGCGNVGGGLFRRLRALGVDCRCYDPFLDTAANPALVGLGAALDSDIVCLHTPLTRSGPHPSYHLLGEAELAQLRPGCVLINAGRGGAVDSRALQHRLRAGDGLQAVLDVWESEPDIEPELLGRTALGTAHIAGYSHDGKVRGTEMVFAAACRHFDIACKAPPRAPAPAGPARSIEVAAAASEWRQITAAVLQAYDIRADDRRLRRAVAAVEPVGRAFDRLRRDYPLRREFDYFSLPASTLKPAARQVLQGLGFR